MDGSAPHVISRRAVLSGSGALIVSFSMLGRAMAQATTPPELPGSLEDNPWLDSWIRVDADNAITVFTGKVELGQGIKTALLQVAAEELKVEPGDITLITADTGRTPDEGFTAGSNSMHNSGTPIRNAAAQVRDIVIAEAARRLTLPPADLHAENKAVVGPDGRSLGYGELVAGNILHVEAKPQSRLKAHDAFRVMGKPLPRVDIPAKVTEAPPMCTTSALRAWCMPVWCDRQVPARG